MVYNHTAEGNQLGPTLSFRGIDNQAYYRLNRDNPRFYVDYTGTGNSLNMMHPRVQQLITDSLRYWVLEMHVDGFRFDLAATLARELHDVDHLGRSWTSSTKIRFSPRSNSSPSPGISVKAATRWGTSPWDGRNGTTNTAIPFAATGRATAE